MEQKQANMFSATDRAFMERALHLAQRALWTARPNPMVGCVIVNQDHIVGEGFHVRRGGPHAEVFALQQAGARAHGATAYVTLEPCAHVGLTPACAPQLVQAGVARVVAASLDPFVKVAGHGFELLRTAGIKVEVGLLEHAARALNCGYFSRIERKRPWVRVKVAASLDGRSAMADGSSQWITSAVARQDGHRWRARAGAILTGANTVLHDDPSLTVRLPDADVQPPLRVVLDSRLRCLSRHKVRHGSAPTLYVHAPDCQPPPQIEQTAEFAAIPLDPHRDGLDLNALLALLADRGVNELHVEAGAILNGAFLRQGLADELLCYVAPVFLGDEARPMLTQLGIDRLEERLQWSLHEVCQVGEDVRLILRPRQSASSAQRSHWS